MWGLLERLRGNTPQKRFLSLLEKGDSEQAVCIVRLMADLDGEFKQPEATGASSPADLDWAKAVDANAPDHSGLRPIHVAAKRGLTAVVEELVEKAGVDVDSLDEDGNTALHWAAKAGQAKTVAWLVGRGASREVLNASMALAADVAASPAVRALIVEGAKDKDKGSAAFVTPPKPPEGEAAAAMGGESSGAPLSTPTAPPEPTPPQPPRKPLQQPSSAVAPSSTSSYTTPVKPPTGRPSLSARKRYSVSPMINRTPRAMTPGLGDAVLRAAVDTASCLASPTAEWSRRKEVFDACAMYRATPEHAKIKGLKTKLQQDPALAKARSIQLNNLAQDGFTPLHAAASVGNMHAVEALLELPREFADPFAVDLQGRTPLHIAAESGNVEIVKRLKDEMRRRTEVEPVGEHAPQDLAGRTPVALALSAKKGRQELEQELFALGDPSICPSVPLHSRSGGESLWFGYCSTQGWQQKMEDTLCVHTPMEEEDEETGLFAVFDGHQGKLAAEYAADHMCETLQETAHWQAGDRSAEALAETLRAACMAMDARLAEIPQMKLREEVSRSYGSDAAGSAVRYVADDESGSTAVLALVTRTHVAVGNLGDSRIVLLSRGEDGGLAATALSRDHTPDLPDERARAEAAGGFVEGVEFTEDKDQPPRIIFRLFHTKGLRNSIMMTRALGDFPYKRHADLPPEQQMVTCVPEVHVRERQPGDELLVLACDGVWDVLTNDDLAAFVRDFELRSERPKSPSYLAQLSDEIVKESMRRGSRDNITALVVRLAAAPEERRALVF